MARKKREKFEACDEACAVSQLSKAQACRHGWAVNSEEFDRAVAAVLAVRRRGTIRCPACQDRPGKDGLGRQCKRCLGTGYIGSVTA